MAQLALTLIFLFPILVIGGILYWIAVKPTRELAARAAAGDPSAQAELAGRERARAAMRRMAGRDDPERRRLLLVGKPGRATVVEVRPLGLRIAPESQTPRRMIEVDLSLDGEGGGAPRKVTVTDVVAEPLLGRLLQGSTVPVRVDPADPQKVAVLWDTL